MTGAAPLTFTSAIPNTPANLIAPGKTVMRVNCSVLRVNGSSTGAIDFAIRLGTLGDASDPYINYIAGISATNNYFARASSKITFPDSTHFLTNRGNADAGVGTHLLYEGGPTHIDITQA